MRKTLPPIFTRIAAVTSVRRRMRNDALTVEVSALAFTASMPERKITSAQTTASRVYVGTGWPAASCAALGCRICTRLRMRPGIMAASVQTSSCVDRPAEVVDADRVEQAVDERRRNLGH